MKKREDILVKIAAYLIAVIWLSIIVLIPIALVSGLMRFIIFTLEVFL